MTIAIDASVAAKWFLDEPSSDAARSLRGYAEPFAAPDFLLVEMANVLWKAGRRASIDAASIDEALTTLHDEIRIDATVPLISGALQLARERDHPVYDCLYVEFARSHRIRLATADRWLRDIATSVLGDGAVIWVG